MKINWERTSAMLTTLLLASLVAYVALRFLVPLLLPFLIAWLVSRAIVPLARRIGRILHLPYKPCAVVLLCAVILLGAWGLWMGGVQLLSQLLSLVNRLISDGVLSTALDGAVGWLSARGLPFSGEELSLTLQQMLDSALSALSSKLPEVIGGVLGALPRLFFVAVVTVISGFYFCVDGERIGGALLRSLPSALRTRLPAWRGHLRKISWGYLRAYLLLLGLTLLLLFVGFLVLDVDYALLLALLIALADLLPVIGVGTVMIPWSLILLVQKELFLGFGLLLLYLAVELIRQILEPRLLGKSLGLHPLAALLASYVGFCLFGFFGMLFAPVVATVGKTLFGRMLFSADSGT